MSDDGKVEVTQVRDVHRFDEESLKSYLKSQIEGFGDDLEVRQFPVGQSNPTYQLTSGGKKYVLRKKPPGVLLPSAHAVDREYRVISALQSSDVPVPKTYVLCEDPDVIGTDFYVMQMVEGRVFHDPGIPGVSVEDRREIYDRFIRHLADLHRVDYEAVGLGDFGKPGAYIERQVSRWARQYDASKTGDIPEMEKLVDWLPNNLPADQSVSIVHGDYRPGNTITHPTEPRIEAILDWELCTLGHPLADLGYCCAGYHGENALVGNFSALDYSALGIPTEAEFVERYCHYSGRDGIEDFHYYVIFSQFRSAAIIQGVYKRGLDGNASSADALKYGDMAIERAEIAWSLVEKHF